jgi:hypothetical protein
MASAMITTFVAEVRLPSAAPVPRSPSLLLLGSATGLLIAPGCPACRYAAESSEAYLTWFAVEGHGDAQMLRQMCSSRGMCGRHTRRLLSQPGAAGRLTAVYKYVVSAAIADPSAAPASCPACDQEVAAEDRVLGILLEEVPDRMQYKLHGGLCLPHLRRAGRLNRKRDVRWLIRFMIKQLSEPAPSLDLIAGQPDQDADSRAAFRADLPLRRPVSGPWTCAACWAVADAERVRLADASASGESQPGTFPADCMCPLHLRDVGGGAIGMLAREAARHADRLAQTLDGQRQRLGIAPGWWLSSRARRALADPDCPVCRGSQQASAGEIDRQRIALRDAERHPQSVLPLCVRHLSRLHAADPLAGQLAASALRGYAGQLLGDLDTAFAMRTWAHRNDARGLEMTAWRRAAVFLDGSVFGGCPAS